MVTLLQWIEGSLMIVSFLLCLIWTISLFHGLFCVKIKNDQIALKPKIIAMIALICYILTIILFFIGEIFYFNDYWVGYPYIIVSFTWGTGNTFTNILFMRRIHDIFHKTVYKSSIWVYIILISLITLYWLLQAICISLIELFATYHIISVEWLYKIANGVLFTEGATECLMVVAMLYLFISKLMKLTLSQMDSFDNNAFTVNNKDDLTLSNRQKKLLNVITKLTILVGFGLTTSQMCEFYSVGQAFIFWYEIDINPDILHLILIGLMVLDSVVNSFAIYLSFTINNKLYYKICICCHKCCGFCCVKITKQKMIKTIMEMKLMSDMRRYSNSKSMPLLQVN